MAEGGDFHPPSTAAGDDTHGHSNVAQNHRPSFEQAPLEQVDSILRSRANTPNPFSRRHSSLDLDDYFVRTFTLCPSSPGFSGACGMPFDLLDVDTRSAAASAGTVGSADLMNLQTGPRDILKHSKWPMFMQMHGSILPKMIVPLFILGGWATCITCISELTRVQRT